MTIGNKIVVYTDGGARGNPGPAAIGIWSPDLHKGWGIPIGSQTNNVAEWMAFFTALEKIKDTIGKVRIKKTVVECRMDSELVVKQWQRRYKIQNPPLQRIFLNTWNQAATFADVFCVHVPREHNKQADDLVNEALDGNRTIEI